ncbi:hypothetical protein KC19_12G020400 [Ceratodon purpureus]|uniref:Uncharacterized protein n=1 Tax=Ceratodon purpureus TaxID=3225 RepID=A0A8T0G531_CERPU|nr:hypothetical protein KC19_12G020400 [Ceratodon purpureus]
MVISDGADVQVTTYRTWISRANQKYHAVFIITVAQDCSAFIPNTHTDTQTANTSKILAHTRCPHLSAKLPRQRGERERETATVMSSAHIVTASVSRFHVSTLLTHLVQLFGAVGGSLHGFLQRDIYHETGAWLDL